MREAEKLWKYELHEIDNVAKNLISIYSGFSVWIFKADMGMGKTTLIKTLCRQWGVIENMSSPTFSIVNEYQAKKGNIYHFDLYRLKAWDEVENLGIMDYIFSGERCLVEWPDLLLNYLPLPYVQINGILAEGNLRIFTSQLYD